MQPMQPVQPAQGKKNGRPVAVVADNTERPPAQADVQVPPVRVVQKKQSFTERAVEKVKEWGSPRKENSNGTAPTASSEEDISPPLAPRGPVTSPQPTDGPLFNSPRKTSTVPTNGHSYPEEAAEKAPLLGTNGADTAIVPAGKLAGAVAYVKDGAVVVYGKVQDRIVMVRAEIRHSTELARAKAAETFKKVEELLLAGKARTKAELKQLQQKALKAGTSVKVAVKSAADRACDKALILARKIPVPLKVKNGAVYMSNKVGEGYVFVKDGCMHIVGRVGDVVVKAKVRGVQSIEAAKSRGYAEFAKVTRVVERYDARLKSGLAAAKGKAGNTLLSIRARADKTKTKALEAGAKVWERVEAMPVTKKLMNGVSVVKSKTDSATVYVKDGYVHAVTKVNDQYVYTKAQIVKRGGAIKLQVLETYASTEARLKAIVDQVVLKALASYNFAKEKSLTAAEAGKVKALALADYSKTVAADKPVSTSAASGAVLLGTGGGVAGLAAGSVAGAAAGLPLALFTFGLSIPVGAVVGGGAGACVGAVTAGTAGAVGGGAAGYSYEHRAQIKNGYDNAVDRAAKCKDYVKETAVNSRDSVVARLRGSTGGSA